MTLLIQRLMADERGLVLTAELVLVLTIGVLAVVVGLNAVAKAINYELSDVAGAIGAVDQTYFVTGFLNSHGNAGAAPAGFGFFDRGDECDCGVIFSGGPAGFIGGGEAVIGGRHEIHGAPVPHGTVAPHADCIECEPACPHCHAEDCNGCEASPHADELEPLPSEAGRPEALRVDPEPAGEDA